MLAVEDVLDDVELVLDFGGVDGDAVAFESRDDLAGFVVFAFADEQAGGVREEGAEGPDAEGEEDLEGEGELEKLLMLLRDELRRM